MYKLFIKSFCIVLISILLFLTTQSINIVNANPVFSDNFNRNNEASLGPNWTLFYGGQPAGIENNQAYIEVGAGGYWGLYKVTNLNIQNQDVSVRFTHQNGDTTLLLRVIDLNNRIAINYYQSSGLQIYEVNNGNYRLIPNTAPNAVVGNIYTFRARAIGNSLKVWVNDILYADANLNYVTSGSAGFGANDGYTKVYFDDFIVTDGVENTSTPDPTISPEPITTEIPTPTTTLTPTNTPIPTTTPTPTATATPMYPVLSVPSLKQYSVPWKNKIYDHTKSTIEEFGCALTSAVMVLQYHGHIILPDTLNNWLKNQNDGYLRNGLLNWLAISRYTKLNDSSNSPTLEYKRLEANNENLDNELESGRPAILKEDGHFVVATGKNSTTYLINDPGYPNRNTLDSYSNNFLSINSYTPTHSDLSYMMFVVDEDINLTLKDEEQNIINGISYIEEPIKSIKDQNKFSGSKLKILIFEKPDNGQYELSLSGPKGSYQLDSYLYDTNGKLNKNTFSGKIINNETDQFNISYESKIKIKKEKENKHYWNWEFFKKFKKWW